MKQSFPTQGTCIVEVTLLSPETEHDYERFIRSCSAALVQHTPAWRDAVAGVGTDMPVYLIAKSHGSIVGALPAFVFKCELGDLMLSIPQAGGYGGVIVSEDCASKEAVYAALLSRLISEATARGCLCVTICTPPFFAEVELYRKYFASDFERENFFQYLDLRDQPVVQDGRPSPSLRANIRRNLKTAERNKLYVSSDDTDERFDEWYVIYQNRMQQLNADAIPRAFFSGIREHVLPQGNGFFLYVLNGQQQVIGGGLFVGHAQVIDYFMASSDAEHVNKQPNSLLMYEAIKLASARGYRYWNWQSSDSRQSPVYFYKAGWGSREGLHYYFTKVTGDISALVRTPLEFVREKYRWHYVMPFQQFRAEPPTGGTDE